MEMSCPSKEVMSRTIFGGLSLFDPVCEVADKVEEKVLFRNGDDLISDFNKEAEAFVRLEREPLRDALTKVLGPCRRIHFKGLKRT